MTFGSRERSRTKGIPHSLYFIRYGDTAEAFFAYTDAEQPVTLEFDADIGPVTFDPIPISRGRIIASGNLDKSALEIRTPRDSGVSELFREYPPSQVVTVKIFEGHLEEAQVALVWSGRIVNSSRQINEAIFSCEPVSTSMKRPGLTRNYQYQCPLVLYGPECGADIEAATTQINVTSVNGPIVGLVSNWAEESHRPAYVNGMMSWVRSDGRTERRTIIKIIDTHTLLLGGTASGLEAGNIVKLTLGCGHDMESCANLHSNILNFGGQFGIPLVNPIGLKNNF